MKYEVQFEAIVRSTLNIEAGSLAELEQVLTEKCKYSEQGKIIRKMCAAPAQLDDHSLTATWITIPDAGKMYS